MKISKPTISKTIEFLICISFLSLTFRHEISSVCLYLTGFLSIIELIRREKNYFDKNNFVLLFFISYFLVEIIGMFYSKNLYFGIKDIESKLLFLIGSLIIITVKFNINQKIKFIKFYMLGIFLCLTYLFIIGYNEYCKTNIYPKYVNFSYLMHPTYFSLNLVIATIIILEFHNKFLKNKVLVLILLFFLCFGIILTDSKAGLICFFLALFIFFVKYFLTFKLKFKIMFFGLSIIILSFLVNQISKSRLNELFSNLQTTTKFKDYDGYYNSTETRIIIWRITNRVLKNNLILGTGTGDIKDELIKEYTSLNFTFGLKGKYNCHNQFLQILTTFGVISGLLLILIFLKILYDTITKKNLLFSLITLMFFTNFLFESFLETKAGIELFVLLNLLLSSVIYKTEKNIFPPKYMTTD